MSEYTYSNIIIDPTKEGIESLIGKEVYFHNNPSLCLENANEKSTSNLGILVEISKNSIVPFRIEQKCGTCAHTCAHACIIVKKEEPKMYVPFKDRDEFIEYYLLKATNLFKHKLESLGGIWLRYKEKDVLYMVTEIRRDGVITGSDQLSMDWDKLLEYFTFLDGTPCGKPMEE